MINRLARATRKRRRQQGGFTLIELLVVITILGILAAIVSVSLLGITSTARKNALATEQQTVQGAFDVMLHDQVVDSNQDPTPPKTTPIHDACQSKGVGPTLTGKPTQDMTHFPPAASAYPGFSASGSPAVLATYYLREKTTSVWYACDDAGNVYQTLTKPAP
jgi:prepilin-type N-terminal cleavage/methylation domain-containing protein